MPRKPKKEEIFIPFRPIIPRNDINTNRRRMRVGNSYFTKIENLKSLKDAYFRTSKINLIYGKNSSGKSSIIHSLLLSKPANEGISYFGYAFPNLHRLVENFNGAFSRTGISTYDLGNFDQVLNTSAKSKKFVINYCLVDDKTKKPKVVASTEYKEKKTRFYIDFKDMSWEQDAHNEEGIKNRKVKIKFNGKIYFDKTSGIEDGTNRFAIQDIYKLRFSKNSSFTRDGKQYKYLDKLSFKDGIVFRSNLMDVKHLRRLDEFLQYLFASIRAVSLTDELVHIPPIRSIPGRLELNYQDPVQKYLKQALESKEFNQKTFNKWLDSLEIKYRISFESKTNLLGGKSELIVLKSLENSKELSFHDVGKGLSQVLPIILAGLTESDSSILVEQPEIHLHPKMQADLADLFCDKERNNEWYIETHSENILFRIQKNVRLGKIEPKDVSIIYVDSDSKGNAIIKNIDLKENGELSSPFPKGFFDVGLNELF